ncbi:hypothetical protein, partial [uncultured Enterococcus sp.]|uniref:hypothetical protein n=1 Tax=uncultured Enterococcus sp. TaxID=167972 RepID=UPI00258A72CB
MNVFMIAIFLLLIILCSYGFSLNQYHTSKIKNRLLRAFISGFLGVLELITTCLLYTSDAADELDGV